MPASIVSFLHSMHDIDHEGCLLQPALGIFTADPLLVLHVICDTFFSSLTTDAVAPRLLELVFSLCTPISEYLACGLRTAHSCGAMVTRKGSLYHMYRLSCGTLELCYQLLTPSSVSTLLTAVESVDSTPSP